MFSDASTTCIGGALCVCRNNYIDALLILFQEADPQGAKIFCHGVGSSAAGRQFKAFTDHQALSGILDGVQSSSKLTRWKLKLADYDIAIEHIKGLHNPIADSLSWQGWSSLILLDKTIHSEHFPSMNLLLFYGTPPFSKGGEGGMCGVITRYSPTLTEHPLTLTLSLLTCTCLSRFVMIYYILYVYIIY